MKLFNIGQRTVKVKQLPVAANHKKFYHGVSKYYDATVSKNRDYEHVASQLSKELGHAEGVMDIGIGTGLVVEHLLKNNPNICITGIDTCQSLLDRAESRLAGKVELHCCSITEFETNKMFDGAYSRGGAWVYTKMGSKMKLASHIYDAVEVQKSFDVVAKYLRPNSKLLISTTNASSNSEFKIDGDITHYRQVSVIEKKGFSFLKMDYSYFKDKLFLERKCMEARLFDEEESWNFLKNAGFVKEVSSSDDFLVFRKL